MTTCLQATAVVLTFLVDNFKVGDDEPQNSESRRRLAAAKEWETVFVEFMKAWAADGNNTEFMDIAFNSERYEKTCLNHVVYHVLATWFITF